MWASISNGAICIQNVTGGYACQSTARFSDEPLATVEKSSSSPEYAFGLVPDGITSITAVLNDGSSTTVAVVNNAFRFSPEKPVKEIRWTDSNGVNHSNEW
jgi:hypothetical protein